MYDIEELKRLLSLEKYRVIKDDGSVLPPSHTVFKKISEAISEAGSPMSAKHIYTTVKNNRHDFYTHVKNIFMPVANTADKSSSSNNEPSDESFNPLFTLPRCKSNFQFRLIISAEKWVKMKPTKKKPGKPLRLMRNKWSDIVAEKIFEQQNIPCPFSFKSAKVCESTSAKYYAKFKGICKECDAIIEGILLKKPTKQQDALFNCKISNYLSEISHTKKRHLRGYRRREIARELVDGRKPAALIRNNLAKDYMEFGDDIPPIVPNTDVLRKAKQQEIDKRLGLSDTDPVKNLQIAKHTSHVGTIHAIGYDPFFCIYWLQEQKILNNAMYSNKKPFFGAADATGGVTFRLNLPVESYKINNKTIYQKSKYIYLYQYTGVCLDNPQNDKNSSKSCPLYQMISSRHDASFLTFFFTEIIRSGASVPKIIVTDFGKGLLIGAARAFAGCRDLKHYMSLCFNYVVLHEPIEMPSCCLRLDVNHFMAQISHWKCLSAKKKPRIKQFFLRALGHIYSMVDFKEIEDALRAVLVVTLSEHIGTDEAGNEYSSTSYLTHVDNIIKGSPKVGEPWENSEEDSKDSDVHEDESFIIQSIVGEEDSTATSWIDWAKHLFNEAEIIAKSSIDSSPFNLNPFNIPHAAKMLRDLMYYLPLWTAVMYPTFKLDVAIRSSSAVEGGFSKIKNIAFAQLPLRVDKFVLQHIAWLEGEVKLKAPSILDSSQKRKKFPPSKIKTEKGKNFFRDSLDEVENWRGKTKPNRAKVSEISSSHIDLDSSDSSDIVADKTIINDPITDVPTATMPIIDDIDELNFFTTNELIGTDTTIRDETFTLSPISLDMEIYSANDVPSVAGKNYLKDCPDWDSLRDVSANLPVMKNGLNCPPISIKSVKCKVTSTCAFDSLLTLLMQAVLISDLFKEEICSIDFPNSAARLALDILKRGCIEKDHYKTRFIILSNVEFLKAGMCTQKINFLNADSNVAHLFEALFAKMPFRLTEVSCLECDYRITKRLNYMSVNTHILFKFGYHCMQLAIDDLNDNLTSQSICKKCNGITVLKTEYSSYLIIDMTITTSQSYKEEFPVAKRKKCILGTITKSIAINYNQEYTLVGVVNYIENGRHYTAFVFNGQHWHEYDDMSTNVRRADYSTEITPHIFFYVRK